MTDSGNSDSRKDKAKYEGERFTEMGKLGKKGKVEGEKQWEWEEN